MLRSYIKKLMRKARTEINTFQWSSIRSSPFNVYRINVLPSLVSTGAVILSMFSTRWCHYARKNAILGPGDEASEVDIGLYTYAHEGSCYMYGTEVEFDEKFRLARMLGLATNIVGSICMISLWITICMKESQTMRYYYSVGVLLMITTLCEGLTLYFTFESDVCLAEWSFVVDNAIGHYCSMAIGTIFAIASTCAWFFSGILAFVVPAYDSLNWSDNSWA